MRRRKGEERLWTMQFVGFVEFIWLKNLTDGRGKREERVGSRLKTEI